MYKLKKWAKIMVLMMILSITAPNVLPQGYVAIAEAATVKISQKTLTLEVGKSKVLKITGTKKKVTWASSKKSVVTVSRTGKVTAKKAGKATITATVNKKKYTCKVTVKAVKKVVKVNPLIKNAPFEAVEGTYNKLKYILPKDWTSKSIAEQGNSFMLMFYPKDVDLNGSFSNVNLTIQETGTDKADYSVAKEYFKSLITVDLISSQLAQGGLTATVDDFKTSDYESKLGTVFKTDYKVTYEGGEFNQSIYDILIDNYLVELTVTDIGDNLEPDVTKVGEYLLDTIEITK